MNKEPVLSVEELAVYYTSSGLGIEDISFSIVRGEVLVCWVKAAAARVRFAMLF